VFNNKIWVLGGWVWDTDECLNDVWYSSDGVNWTQVTASAPWSSRKSFQCFVYNSKLWIVGGNHMETSSGSTLNDVWSSSDGINWTQVTSAAPWSSRGSHQCIVFDGKMWVLGGFSYSYTSSGGTARTEFNDVWCSSDGLHWTQKTSSAAWGKRYVFQCVSFNGKLWVLGGAKVGSPLYDDVWSSPDGIVWTREGSSVLWGQRARFQAVVLNSRIWILGGQGSSVNLNDVWSSYDGKTWNNVSTYSAWDIREDHRCVVYDNKIWLLGGTGVHDDHNDVWVGGN
jgi:hypothetical protein